MLFLVISTRNWFFYLYPCTKYQSFDYEFQPFSLSSDYSFLLFVPAYLIFLSKNLLPKHQSLWWKSYAPCSYLESKKTQNLQVIYKDKWETKISKNFNMYLCMFWVLTPFHGAVIWKIVIAWKLEKCSSLKYKLWHFRKKHKIQWMKTHRMVVWVGKCCV